MEKGKQQETKETKEDKAIDAELVEEKQDKLQAVPNAQNLWQLAEGLQKSGMFQNVKNAYGAMAIIEYGRELGIQPVMALQSMSVINGRICIESKALLAQAMRSGVKVGIKEKTKEKSVIEFHRPGQEPFTETFTIEDAKKLGFLGKKNWQQYPEEMCFWRCVAKGLRAYAPDILLGLYTVEEMNDAAGQAFGQSEKVSLKKDEYDKEEKPEPKPKKKTTAKKTTKKTTKKQDKPEPKEEKPKQTKTDEKEKIADEVKKIIEKKYKDGEHEYKNFKWFLHEYQMQEQINRTYVGLHYGNPSIREGGLEDIKFLLKNIDKAIEKYEEYKEELAKDGVKIGEKEDEEPPF